MKIIHLILGKANPNRMNGVNKVVHNLASAQIDLGMQVEIWGITPQVSKQSEHEHNYTLKQFKTNRLRFLPLQSLKQEIQKLSGHVVFHIHGGFIFEFYWAARQLKKNSIPYIFTSHGAFNTVALKKGKFRKILYYEFLEKYVVKNAKAVHLIGKSEYEALGMKEPIAKRVLIPNGQLATGDFKSGKPLSELPVFGFMGRITAHTKGLDILLQGFHLYLKKGNPPAKLVIMGDGPDLEKMKQTATTLGIAQHIDFSGAKFGQEKEQLLKEMDFFFHPSRNEGMPGAVLEAAALGIPCIVSNETNVKEYIQKHQAGIGLKENNPNNISSSMEDAVSIINNSRWSYYSGNAQEMVKKEFDWSVIAKRFWNLYSEPLPA